EDDDAVERRRGVPGEVRTERVEVELARLVEDGGDRRKNALGSARRRHDPGSFRSRAPRPAVAPYSSSTTEKPSPLAMLANKAPMAAPQKVTSRPGVNQAASANIPTLMTTRKSPNVRQVSGSEISVNSGLT